MMLMSTGVQEVSGIKGVFSEEGGASSGERVIISSLQTWCREGQGARSTGGG